MKKWLLKIAKQELGILTKSENDFAKQCESVLGLIARMVKPCFPTMIPDALGGGR